MGRRVGGQIRNNRQSACRVTTAKRQAVKTLHNILKILRFVAGKRKQRQSCDKTNDGEHLLKKANEPDCRNGQDPKSGMGNCLVKGSQRRARGTWRHPLDERMFRRKIGDY